jgi:hypothetical protein
LFGTFSVGVAGALLVGLLVGVPAEAVGEGLAAVVVEGLVAVVVERDVNTGVGRVKSTLIGLNVF